MSDALAAATSRCLICRAAAGERELVPGLKGEREALAASLCSPDCREQARRFAARRSAQLSAGRAGLLVAATGVVTAASFLATGRDLGRALLVLSLLGAGTTRLAYPDALPLWLVRRLGLAAALELGQWLGVGLGLLAVALALLFLLL